MPRSTSGIEALMVSLVSYRQLVTILALALSANADPIRVLQASNGPIEGQLLPSAKVVSVKLLYSSALVENKPKPMVRTYFIDEDDAPLPTRSASRATNVLEWLLSIFGKFVLPNQKPHHRSRN